ncbi:MAG: FkbM family methyltransferase [Vicinamibacteria bacterium]|nr:FkbM family methyltransferase [Vicinamibacteria bacterium]
MRLRAIGGLLLRASLDLLPSALREFLTARLLARSPDEQLLRLGIMTLRGQLTHLRDNGFAPATIVDIGAYVGDWSRIAAGVFPKSAFVLIDANPLTRTKLEFAARELGHGSRFEIALLGAAAGTADFHQADTGASVLKELTTFPAAPTVRLAVRRLDDVLGRPPEGPLLLKLDVQGYELEVLRGGPESLAAAEVVIMETSLLPYNEGAPLFGQVVAFMTAGGFAVYDFFGGSRRHSDQALFQTDVVFVRNASALRRPARFWPDEP